MPLDSAAAVEPPSPDVTESARFTSTPEWLAHGDSLREGKRGLEKGPYQVVNAGDFAHLSEALDITGPGTYELVFSGLDPAVLSSEVYGFLFVAPPDTSFAYSTGVMTKVDETTLTVALSVPDEGFKTPYPGFSVWAV